MGRRHPDREEPPLAFPNVDGAHERARDLFGIDIEASLRSWFEEMGFDEERVAALMARTGTTIELGPGSAVGPIADELVLTPRQRESLAYAACGFSRHEVAERMGIGWETVKRHQDSARFRLRASSLTQAVIVAALIGELDVDIVREHLLRNWDA